MTRPDLIRRACAGGRRRDARPLLVRRGEPHLAGGAGAGGARSGAREERPGGAANVARNVAALGRRGGAARGGRRGRSRRQPGAAARARSGVRRAAHARRRPCTPPSSCASSAGSSSCCASISRTCRRRRRWRPSSPTSRRACAPAQVVILSDYGKGGLTHVDRMIRTARAAGKIVLVDPKGDDYEQIPPRHAADAQPRRVPRSGGTLEERGRLLARAQKLRAELELDALLVTRSEEGMTLYHARASVLHVPAVAKEVYDVSGAGDTVIATLGVMLAAGARACRRGALGQQGGRHRGRQARHRRGSSRRAVR